MSVLVLILFSSVYGTTGEVELDSRNEQELSLNIVPSTTKVTIVLAGKSDAWFAVGFNGTDMNNTYAILADYNSDTIYELKLGSGFCSPQCDRQLKPSFMVNSDKVDDGVRTINITRPISINNPDYYSFPTGPGSIHLIWAFGVKGEKFENGTDMGNAGNKKSITLS